MPALSIEQLNARRDHINRNRDTPRLGGKPRADRMLSAETQRVWADAALEYVPTLEEEVADVFNEFRVWFRNLPPVALMLEYGDDESIPF